MTTVDWALRVRPSQRETILSLLNDNLYMLHGVLNFINKCDPDFANNYAERFTDYYNQYKATQPRQ